MRILARAILSIAVITSSALFGQTNQEPSEPQTAATPPPSFELAAIRPSGQGIRLWTGVQISADKVTAKNMTVKSLVTYAYDAPFGTVSGGPSWTDSEEFDFSAKIDDSRYETFNKLPEKEQQQQVRLMVRSLLEDRLKLKVSHETKELPIYALVVAKNGPKLAPPPPDPSNPNPTNPALANASYVIFTKGQWKAKKTTMDTFATLLAPQPDVSRLVKNETGLTQPYDFVLKWVHDDSGPSIFTALEEQLGLKLEPRKAPVETIVIDHVEKPLEN